MDTMATFILEMKSDSNDKLYVARSAVNNNKIQFCSTVRFVNEFLFFSVFV